MQIPVTQPVVPIPAPANQAERPQPTVAAATSPTAAPIAEPEPEPVPVRNHFETREAIAEQVSRYLQTSARNLEFQVEGESSTPVIIVRDGAGNVVRRIPGGAALQMLRLANAQSGTFVNSTA
jgi:uncharacterized FlaG/YvyC family protein